MSPDASLPPFAKTMQPANIVPHLSSTRVGQPPKRIRFLLALYFLLQLTLSAQTYQESLENILNWTSGGSVQWYVQGSYIYSGSTALASGGIGDNQESWIETTVEGPGFIDFWWKVSSEISYDYYTFLVDGKVVESISGDLDWQEKTLNVGKGVHTFRWRYSKDKAFAAGLDRGFLDRVHFITPAAVITVQPEGTHQKEGTTVRLLVGTTGEALQYQWRRNGFPVPGATNVALRLDNSTSSQSGNYDVVITNIYNAVTSQVAVVDIYVPLPMPKRPTAQGVVVPWGPAPYGLPPADLTNAVAVVRAANYMWAALKSDGSVLPWGWNGDCLFCIPQDLTNATALSAGYNHIIALRDDGTVTTWGNSSYCQQCIPNPLTNIVAVSAGYYHSLALRDDGTVVAWGGNQWGQVNVPSGLNDAIAIAAGNTFSMALRRNGTVLVWGLGDSGQNAPPAGLSNIIAIATAATGSTCYALRPNGSVVAWGSGGSGESNPPEGLRNVVKLVPGNTYCLALKQDGTVASWGSGIPVYPSAINNVAYIAAAESSSAVAIITIPLTNPLDTIVAEGSSASLAVVPQGSGQFTYQWSYNGRPITGATNANILLYNVNASQAGIYTVLVYTDQRKAISRPAKLTVTPRNDSFSSPVVVVGGGGTYRGSTVDASTELLEPNHLGAFGGHSLWFTWTAPATGSVTVDTLGSTFDTVVAVYTGESLSSLQLIASDDDAANFNHNSLLTFSCVAGKEYRIVVDGFSGSNGALQLNINPNLAIIGETRSGGSALTLDLFAPASNAVILEASPDLKNWVPVTTNATYEGGVMSIKAPNTTKSAEFYRARLR